MDTFSTASPLLPEKNLAISKILDFGLLGCGALAGLIWTRAIRNILWAFKSDDNYGSPREFTNGLINPGVDVVQNFVKD